MPKLPRTRVVNVKLGEECDVLVDRRSAYGNPYHIGRDGSREEVLVKYNEWLSKQGFDLGVLKGKRLGCHCRPKCGFKGKLRCHAQILAAAVEGCRPEDIE